MIWLNSTFDQPWWIVLGIFAICGGVVSLIFGAIEVFTGDWSEEWYFHWRRNIVFIWCCLFSIGGGFVDVHYANVASYVEHYILAKDISKVDLTKWNIKQTDGKLILVESKYAAKYYSKEDQ